MSRVSIAMATYNGERFLQEQLDSLARQTLLPAELVVTDDGSTDGTLALLQAFAETAPFPVRVISNEKNMGWKANFLKAASLCAGDYIAFCDQDDVWFPEKLRLCFEAFANPKVLLVYHNANIVTEDLKKVSYMDWTDAPRALNPCQSLDPWRTAYGFTIIYRSWLNQFTPFYSFSADFFDISQNEGHDQWFFFLSSALGDVYYISKPLADYRRHSSALSSFNSLNVIGELRNSNIKGFSYRETAARKRAEILQRIRAYLQSPYVTLADSGTKKYSGLAEIYQHRQSLYQAPSLWSRGIIYGQLVLRGAYRSKRNWGVGYKAGIRDLVCGVCRII